MDVLKAGSFALALTCMAACAGESPSTDQDPNSDNQQQVENSVDPVTSEETDETVPDFGDPPAAKAHVANAQEIAGEEFKNISSGLFCQPAELAISTAMRTVPGFLDPKAPGIEPFQAFDNLYYIGLYSIGTWLIDTGEGLILFDTLNNEHEVRAVLLPGMERYGLDPNDIKYIVITHAHFDHYGGAKYLQEEYDIPIVMSEFEWDALNSDVSLPFAIGAGYPNVSPPNKDIEMGDGDELTLGNTTVRFMITPGHTPGTLSSIFNVVDNGVERKIGMWGGNALPTGITELNQMHNSLHRFWDLSQELEVEGLISTHAWITGNIQRAEADISQLFGVQDVSRYMAVVDQCIKAQFARTHSAGEAKELVNEFLEEE